MDSSVSRKKRSYSSFAVVFLDFFSGLLPKPSSEAYAPGPVKGATGVDFFLLTFLGFCFAFGFVVPLGLGLVTSNFLFWLGPTTLIEHNCRCSSSLCCQLNRCIFAEIRHNFLPTIPLHDLLHERHSIPFRAWLIGILVVPTKIVARSSHFGSVCDLLVGDRAKIP